MDGTILCLVDSMRNVSWSHWRGLRNIMQRTRTCKEAARSQSTLTMLRTEKYTTRLLQALIVSATWHRTIEPVEPGEQTDITRLAIPLRTWP
ncbi:conserved hypothetical protein [Aspergillus fumigatus A1163]|uniref:Uncharacterized protein n=1 Tax=Aspergillus fumigatus (strain CBS 144.89 / FGSC A1163 / CEA10) TaxID=451804 RepID=B0Y0L1_ASPFC|nr:conserved hypothetical protein [Aspergillus fumigatus A1163]